MTGYASSSVQAESLSLDFELKSVNSKSLDMKIYLPEYLSVLESELRQCILKNISRGSILFKIKVNQHIELTNHYILNDQVLNNVLEKFENIKVKTLIMTGEFDSGSTPEMSKNLSKCIKNSKPPPC